MGKQITVEKISYADSELITQLFYGTNSCVICFTAYNIIHSRLRFVIQTIKERVMPREFL